MSIILGIEPGRITGYGVIQLTGGKVSILAAMYSRLTHDELSIRFESVFLTASVEIITHCYLLNLRDGRQVFFG